MIRQDQNPTGRSNSGRATPQRNYNRSASFLGLGDLFGGGGQSTQTTTQQNLPDWAIPDAMSTLAMGNYYTQTPDYRASTLDRDYSGIRGYNQMGQPNSQAGQFGLNPTGYTTPLLVADPPLDARPTGRDAGIPTGVWFGKGLFDDGSSARPTGRDAGIPTGAWFGKGLFDDGSSARPTRSDGAIDYSQYGRGLKMDEPFFGTGRGRGRSAASEDEGNFFSDAWDSITDFFSSDSETTDESETGSGLTTGEGSDLLVDDEDAGTAPEGVQPGTGTGTGPNGSDNTGGYTQPTIDNTGGYTQPTNNNTNTTNTTPEQPTIDPRDIFNPDDLTPFQAYDRQRFAAPSQNTLLGEGILAGRYNQRFGPGGTDPFSEAQAAARGASNYRSQFTPAALNLQGPTANTYNNVNQGLLADQYGNANQGLTPAQDYSRDFQQNLAQFQDPYTSQVVDQTIQDLDRARRITNNDISGSAAKSGAFGGSREILMRAENNRNFADRTAAAVGQLRAQGFQQAADRAQQEQLQRLGLTASDIQNLRGYQSAGNLQGQNISAQDVRDVRALQSQGALTAQGLRAQSDRDAMNFANQLQMQGNQIAADQARLAEQFRQGAGALNLQGAGALGDLAQAGIADERQRIADMLAAGQAGDARNQQDLDFIYGEFDRELAYPGQQIDLRNAAISPATGSIVTTTQPRYEQNPLVSAIGAGVGAYGLTKNPYLALLAGGAGLLS